MGLLDPHNQWEYLSFLKEQMTKLKKKENST